MTTLVRVTCACSGTGCAWISHIAPGETCDNEFAGDIAPLGWAALGGDGLCCPSCLAIREIRKAAPLPIRWSKERFAFLDEGER